MCLSAKQLLDLPYDAADVYMSCLSVLDQLALSTTCKPLQMELRRFIPLKDDELYSLYHRCFCRRTLVRYPSRSCHECHTFALAYHPSGFMLSESDPCESLRQRIVYEIWNNCKAIQSKVLWKTKDKHIKQCQVQCGTYHSGLSPLWFEIIDEQSGNNWCRPHDTSMIIDMFKQKQDYMIDINILRDVHRFCFDIINKELSMIFPFIQLSSITFKKNSTYNHDGSWDNQSRHLCFFFNQPSGWVDNFVNRRFSSFKESIIINRARSNYSHLSDHFNQWFNNRIIERKAPMSTFHTLVDKDPILINSCNGFRNSLEMLQWLKTEPDRIVDYSPIFFCLLASDIKMVIDRTYFCETISHIQFMNRCDDI